LDGLEYVKRIHTVDAQGQVLATKDIVYYQMDDKTLKAQDLVPQVFIKELLQQEVMQQFNL